MILIDAYEEQSAEKHRHGTHRLLWTIVTSVTSLPFTCTCRPSPPRPPIDGAAEGTESAGGIGMRCVIVGSTADTFAGAAATYVEWRVNSTDNGAPAAVLFCVAPSHLMSVIVAKCLSGFDLNWRATT